MKRIGIFGGTFDPIHLGHLITAEQVLEQMKLDEIWLLPNQIPPHKDGARASSQHRLAMLQLVCEDHPSLRVESYEIERSGPSYTIRTMEGLHALYPSYQFFFIIGGDMAEYLPQWKEIDQLLQLVQFIAVERPGYEVKRCPYPLHVVSTIPIALSSSMVRERLGTGRSVRYLLPAKVEAYIKEHHLYGR
ncbi:nicotinate-nucleotide adenylyltransferase [Rubeoparvulum massiliense]|uniref:nicotinate-nucleotide adenylyltransferase n=1 Tax=Rubeoparvulum massiliense TaxID=1631346 RepID=UPI00065DE61A|nr:nicotinate-nucleotide adenylyltransferase [Rubeoparvulum massiliense]